jgi:formylglycine-generating enzyme required for sulfatase activity
MEFRFMLRSATILLAALAGIVAGIARSDQARAGEFDFGIVITNSTYLRSDVNSVEYAHRDGEAMGKALQEVFSVPAARIRDYKDTTLSGFYGLFGRERAKDGEIYNLLRGTHPKSRIFVYYAGHGVPRAPRENDEDKSVRAYLLPTDGNPLSPENSGYAVAELIERLKQIKADLLPEGQIFLILEACFTGGTDRGTVVKGISAGAVPAKLAPLASSANNDIVIMTASQGNQVASWDDELKMSVFTNTLIDGLYGWADEARFHGNADKKLTLKELYSFTTTQVNLRLDKLEKKRAQHPSFTGPDNLELVRYDHPLIRDRELQSSEERTCKRLKDVGSEGEITKFLSGCRYCMCQQELNEKLGAMRIGRSACVEDRKLSTAAIETGNLTQLTYLSSNTACPNLKEEMAPHLSRLRETCDDEKRKADTMKVAADLRRMATSARCLDIRASASERADRMEQACSQSRAQWEDLKERGMPEDLRRFGQRIGCPEIQILADALAEERQKSCQIEKSRFGEFARKRNYNGIRMLSERAGCPEVKIMAVKAVDNLAREQEEQCKTDEAKWAAFTDRADPEKLRKIRSEIECDRVAAEIDKEIEKHKPSLVSGPVNDCPTCPKVVGIKPACFAMGAPASDKIADENERPVTTVRIAAPFALGVTEVTVAEWAECHKQGACRVPPPAGDDKLPMRGVSYEDAKGYVGWLQRTTGLRFRLPTEAEWEFAARGGRTSPFGMGDRIDQSMARFSFGSTRHTSPVPVGSFKPNDFGVYDMHGNVAELVEDCYEPSHAGRPRDSVARTSCSTPGRHVVRGGSWSSFPKWLRASYRDAISVREQRPDVGFRVAREAPELAGTMSAPSSCP